MFLSQVILLLLFAVIPIKTSRTIVTRDTMNHLLLKRRSNGQVSLLSQLSRRYQHTSERFYLLKHFTGPDGYTVKRVFGYGDRHARLFLDQLVQSAQEGSPSGEHYALVHYIGGKFRGRLFQRILDRVDYSVYWLPECLVYFTGRKRDIFREPGDKVPPPDFHVFLFRFEESIADIYLDLFGRPFADHQVVFLFHEKDDRFVEFVSGDSQRPAGDYAAE